MPRNGSGTFNRIYSWVTDASNGLDIDSTRMDSDTNDIGSAITQSIAYDGQTVPIANLPMGGYRHTGVGSGVAPDDYAALGQLQTNAATYCGTAGGTGDAITITPSPAITTYAAGQSFSFIASAANTGAVTLDVNGLGAKSLLRTGSATMGVGDIAAGSIVVVEYDGTQFQLINRYIVNDNNVNFAGTATGTGDAITFQGSPPPLNYVTGQIFVFIASAANTGAATVNINSLGAKNIRLADLSAPTANQIIAGMAVILEYDGTQFQLINPWFGKNISGRLVGTQIFTSSGTYTPNPLASFAIIEQVGAGGASGGTNGYSVAEVSAGGSSGGYRKFKQTTLSSTSVTVGVGGVPVAGADGGYGGDTIIYGSTAAGGSGSPLAIGTAAPVIGKPGSVVSNSGSPSAGTILVDLKSESGALGVVVSSSVYWGGTGGSNPLGTGALGVGQGVSTTAGKGGGGSGLAMNSATAFAGINGGDGLVIIYEYT